MLTKLDDALKYVQSKSDLRPELGVILGSGLGDVVDAIDVSVRIPYGEIPHAPVSKVVGHSGNMILGTIGAKPVVILQGRVHYYEGWAMDEVLFLARLLGRMGVKQVIVTNAAGGVNTSFAAGDLMLISDHINLLGTNPLMGPNLDPLGPRFPDMSDAYTASLRALAKDVAQTIGLKVQEGVYIAVSGPSYETPAEIRAFRVMGADAVGMSTVPEVIAFAHMGMKVLGISCITNMAAGVLPKKLDHSEVLETTARVQKEFTAFVLGILGKM
jgi:purine-nucleoside phosphorylase